MQEFATGNALRRTFIDEVASRSRCRLPQLRVQHFVGHCNRHVLESLESRINDTQSTLYHMLTSNGRFCRHANDADPEGQPVKFTRRA